MTFQSMSRFKAQGTPPPCEVFWVMVIGPYHHIGGNQGGIVLALLITAVPCVGATNVARPLAIMKPTSIEVEV